MASKRHVRRKSCTGKIKYESKEDAVIKTIIIKRKTGEKLNAYKCKFCKRYHIGHKPKFIIT